MKLLGQRQKTLLLPAKPITRASYLCQFPRALQIAWIPAHAVDCIRAEEYPT